MSEPVALVASERGCDPGQATDSPARRNGTRRSGWLFVTLALVLIGAFAVAAARSRPSKRGAGAAPPPIGLRLRAFPYLPHVWLVGSAPPGAPPDAPLGVPLLADLSTGRVRFAFGVADKRQDAVLVRGGDLVVPAMVGTLVVERPTAPRPMVRRVGAPFSTMVAGGSTDTFWGVTECAITLGGGPNVVCQPGVTELGVDGRVRAARLLPSGWYVGAGGLDDDQLLLTANGVDGSRLAVWDPRAGAFRGAVPVPPGAGRDPALLAVAGHFIVWRALGGPTCCVPVLTDLRTGEARALAGAEGSGPPSGPAAQFSPDERYVAIQTRKLVEGRATPLSAVTVFDTHTATPIWRYDSTMTPRSPRRHGNGPGIVSSMVWDPSSRWLFFTADSRLFAHRIGAGENVELGTFAPVAAFTAR